MENPWYQQGLQFECTRCGNCCTGARALFGWMATKSARLPTFKSCRATEFEKAYTRLLGSRRSLAEKANGDCIFFERDRGCTIYSVRPRQCRTWPFWESNVRTSEDWRETCEICPGAGQGPLIPSEEITRRMKVIKL